MMSKNKPKQQKQTPRNAGSRKGKTTWTTNPWLWALGACIVTGLVFLPMFSNGFTNWDDEIYVLNNDMLRGPDWHAIFTRPVAANYHPLTVISFALNYVISGTEPWSYLLFNFLFFYLKWCR